MSRLMRIIDHYKDTHGQPGDASVARAIGVKPQTISSWRRRGIKEPPDREALRALANLVGADYESVVLRAALLDAGWVEAAVPLRPDIYFFDDIGFEVKFRDPDGALARARGQMVKGDKPAVIEALHVAAQLLLEQPDIAERVTEVKVVTPSATEHAKLLSSAMQLVPPPADLPDVESAEAYLADAARSTGTESKGRQRRAAADQAGEPPADDPNDMEPR